MLPFFQFSLAFVSAVPSCWNALPHYALTEEAEVWLQSQSQQNHF